MTAKRGKGRKRSLKLKQAGGSSRIKNPDNPSRVSTNKKKPKFTFEHLSRKFDLGKCNRDEKAHLIDKLRMLGSLTWQAIGDNPKESNGYEMIPFDQIRVAKPRFLTDDVTDVMIFRFHGKNCRLAGHRQGEVFYLIFIDPHLALYRH